MSEEKKQRLKEYQTNYRAAKKSTFFFHCIKMRKGLVFNNAHNNYSIDKYYFQKDKKPINISEVDTKKIVLSNKAPYDKEGANKYYIGYVGSTSFRPLHIIIKNIKLYANLINVLAIDNELLKYIEIWNKIKDLLNKRLYNVYNG